MKVTIENNEIVIRIPMCEPRPTVGAALQALWIEIDNLKATKHE